MKSFLLLAAFLLSSCTDVKTACPAFRPSAPFTSPRLSVRDRELLEVNGEYAAYNTGLICGSMR